jgi:hypothetical protein
MRYMTAAAICMMLMAGCVVDVDEGAAVGEEDEMPYDSASQALLGCGRAALQASNGQYVVAEGGGGGVVNANRNNIGAWETFRYSCR